MKVFIEYDIDSLFAMGYLKLLFDILVAFNYKIVKRFDFSKIELYSDGYEILGKLDKKFVDLQKTVGINIKRIIII